MPTLLVVDDSAVERRLAGGLLESWFDCQVLYAADGHEALRQMQNQPADLVLTDLQMPGMNGLELVAAVKADYPAVPVILMTAVGSEEIAAEALRLGAASYVPKRRLTEDLAATIERVWTASRDDRSNTSLMHYLEATDAEFSLQSDLMLIQTLVGHVQQLLRCLPLGDENERLRVGIALEEALKNAYYHGSLEVGCTLGQADRSACDRLARERLGQAPFFTRRIRVRVRVDRNSATFTVRDEGPGFDVQGASAGLLSADQATGRGITLMRSIMDDVTFNSAGNEVTLVKRRAPQPTADDLDEDDSA